MILFDFLISISIIIVLITLSIIVPFFTYLVPFYKVKKFNLKTNMMQKIIGNIAIILILIFIRPSYAMYYLILSLFIEAYYYIMYYRFSYINTFDKIVIGSILNTAIFFVLYKFNEDAILRELYNSYKMFSETISVENINITIQISNMILIMIFMFIFLTYFLFYYNVHKKYYRVWKMSPLWLIFFIVIVFLENVLNIKNFYTYNIIECCKFIYIIYGIKSIYIYLLKLNPFRILNYICSILLGLYFPLVVFVIGAILSFDIKVKILKIGGK